MDSLLSGLFGGQDDDSRSRDKAQDFINRYDDGAPHENITDEEAVNNYQAVASRLSPQELEDSAAEAYERMSPDERREMARLLNERSGVQFDQVSDDPRGLAQMTSRVQAQQPDGIAGFLGGMGGGGMLGGLLGGGNDQNRQQRGGSGGGMSGLMQNPIARGALGGIAAMAMRKMISR